MPVFCWEASSSPTSQLAFEADTCITGMRKQYRKEVCCLILLGIKVPDRTEALANDPLS